MWSGSQPPAPGGDVVERPVNRPQADAAAGRLAVEAERLAEEVRTRMNADPSIDPAELFEHVYAQPTAALERQRAALLAELADLEETP